MKAATKKAAPKRASAKTKPVSKKAKPSEPVGKLDRITALLKGEKGATVEDLMEATGWQSHSVRGALAGALKKRGLSITSQKIDGARVYRAKA
jgi:hypothetical protein